jgi:16S rRNA (guanine527-N7)-methyltransferase
MGKRDVFYDFLKSKFGDRSDEILAKFDILFSQLVEINSQINLFSRQTNLDDLWTLHFLDSLLILDTQAKLDKKIICDIGTGGGLPGIPLAIVYPQSQVFMLDSKKKKLSAIEKICKKAGLSNCKTIHTRVEDARQNYEGYFDVITSRALKILPEFVLPMRKMMRQGAKIYLYKSEILDDCALFEDKKLYDVSRENVGKRTIVEII